MKLLKINRNEKIYILVQQKPTDLKFEKKNVKI